MLMITGARGWEHALWQETYYPKEIANDWHLTYYTKEFQTALAPVALWSVYNIEEINEFCSDVTEEYPLLFEQNDEEHDNSILQKQQIIDEFIPNWIIFKKDGWQKTETNYQIKQAEIIRNKNLGNNAAVFCVYSTEVLNDIALQEIMMVIKKEFKQHEIVYCYFDGALISIETLNTVKTLRRMLALD